MAKGGKINNYSPEYKDEAVKYWRNAGKSVPACAADLSIKANTLSRWVTLSNRAERQDGAPKTFEESSRLKELENKILN